MAFDPIKILEYGSHLSTVMQLVTDAFHSGRTYERSTSPTESYKKMLDEMIGIRSIPLLRRELEAKGVNADQALTQTAEYFRRNPVYIPALRESLAACPSAEARVDTLFEFATASEEERGMICQIMDQRHPAAKMIYERIVKVSATWKHTLRHDLNLDQARRIREFLKSLSSWKQRQFRLSIGALTNTDERRNVLMEVLFAHPDTAAMREIAVDRGLIKSGEDGHLPEVVGKIFGFAKDLATPRPHTHGELARERALLRTEVAATRAALARNPLVRLFNIFR